MPMKKTKPLPGSPAVSPCPDEYRDILMNAPIGFFTTTPEGKVLEVNPVMAAICGYESPETMVREVDDIAAQVYANPEDRKEAIRLMENQGRLVNFECLLQRRDGSRIWANINARAVRNKEGKVVLHQGFITDITERKVEQESLLKTQFAMDKAPDSILWVDDEGFIVYANDASCSSMGYTRDELLTMKVFDIDPDFPQEKWEEHKEAMRCQGRMTFESRHLAKDGRTFPVEVSTNHFTYKDSYMACAFDRDISDRKHAEEEKAKLQEQLDRARHLEALGTLAGGVAHDFNNLLMVIQGHAALMMAEFDSSHPYYNRLKHIEEQVKSGADLTAQLLGFARGGRYRVLPININQVVKKTSEMFGRTRKELSIHGDYHEGLWAVEADRSQMEQVFMNIFLNAAHAMPSGGDIFIETKNRVLDEAHRKTGMPGNYVEIRVTDTGMGMNNETMKKIFDPFFTTKGMGRGFGLGLATVFGIIEGHGGMIDVVSEPGRGSTFTIHLPGTDRETVEDTEHPREITGGTETILLVDDERDVINVCTELLESLGYRVHAVMSGQEALALYQQKQADIDLVILDMIMPGISGSETFSCLREINPEQVVLLSSGYSIDSAARDILDRGCNGFLQKPIHLEELALQVRAVLDKKRE